MLVYSRGDKWQWGLLVVVCLLIPATQVYPTSRKDNEFHGTNKETRIQLGSPIKRSKQKGFKMSYIRGARCKSLDVVFSLTQCMVFTYQGLFVITNWGVF